MRIRPCTGLPHPAARTCPGERRLDVAWTRSTYFVSFLRTNPPIGEALTADALKHEVGALRIVDAKLNAIAVAEIELDRIAMQMLLPAMLIDALHAALKDREE